MKAIFSIGETAKIHHISKQTLIFYDKKGLLKPYEVNSETGYRYYSLDEFAVLDIIIFLKDIGVSLDDIKMYLSNRNIEKVEEFLNEQRNVVNEKIEKLKAVRTKIDSALSVYEDYKDYENKKGPFIKEKKEEHYLFLPVKEPYDDAQIDLSLKKLLLFVEQQDYLADYSMGTVVKKDDLKKGDLRNTGTFIIINKALRSKYYRKMPKGSYATIYHYGAYENLKDSYDKLLSFIKTKGYIIDGDAFEYLIFDIFVVQNKKDFVTELSIKIK